ncbi:L-fuculose phosphate aldolase [Yersinia phage vB_YenM_P778]
MLYKILLEALGLFLWRLIAAILSQRVIQHLFLRCAEYLASKTDTQIDDEFVANLRKSLEETPNDVRGNNDKT